MKTFHLKQKDIEKKWVLFDADGQVLGRLASKIAVYLRGKNKPQYTPHLDCGDNVVVINAEKIAFNGSTDDKKYHRHTGYPGGIKTVTLTDLLKTKPDQAIFKAVRGMLSKNPLGRQQLTNLRVYRGSEHPHEAQKPEIIS